ncbi:MAG: sugar ABC transporter substrate-binding protein [Treponema sp.]|nr:sugar ABC transporter substrate-binding protein [Treponema sp.]
MKQKMVKVAFVFALACLTAACGGREEQTRPEVQGTAASSKKAAIVPYRDNIKIAYVAHDIGTPVNQAWFDGMKREIVDYPNITLQGFDGKSSAENQVKIMDEIITQKYNAIILQASDNAALAPSVTKAEKAGIPVITLNLDVDSPHAGLVKMADYDAGRLIAEQVAKEFNGKGKFVIIQGIVGGIRPIQLEQGFRDAAAKYPGMEILAAQPADFVKEKAMTVMNSFLQTYSQIDGVFAINDAMAMGAALAAESAGRLKGMSIWGADGEKDALTMIEQGKLTGTIYTNCYDEGSTALKLALYVLGSEYDTSTVSVTAVMAMQPVIATKATVGSIAARDRW